MSVIFLCVNIVFLANFYAPAWMSKMCHRTTRGRGATIRRNHYLQLVFFLSKFAIREIQLNILVTIAGFFFLQNHF